MTDRELLELAARGAGYGFRWLREGDREVLRVVYSPADNPRVFNSMNWNPLYDSGDAFRLAVELSLHVKVCRNLTMVEMCDLGDDLVERHGKTPMAATRRAIVRAAAEIGKAMP